MYRYTGLNFTYKFSLLNCKSLPQFHMFNVLNVSPYTLSFIRTSNFGAEAERSSYFVFGNLSLNKFLNWSYVTCYSISINFLRK